MMEEIVLRLRWETQAQHAWTPTGEKKLSEDRLRPGHLSPLPPGLGSADNLQVSEASGAQSWQYAAGDTTRASPGQEVVPRALHCA